MAHRPKLHGRFAELGRTDALARCGARAAQESDVEAQAPDPGQGAPAHERHTQRPNFAPDRHEVALTFDLGLSKEYEWVPLAEIPPYILLSANHPLASSRKLSLHALKEEPLVLLDLPHTREYFLSLFYGQHITPAIKYRVTGFETIRTLVGNGLGYAVLNLQPRTAKTYDGSVVRYVPIKERLRPLTIGCLYLKRITLRKLTRTFIDYSKGYFAREHGREKAR